MGIGYDNLDINHNLVLDLSLRSGAGTVALDESKNHYPFILTGAPAWAGLASGIRILNFVPGNPDFLEATIAVAADLDYTSEDFALAFWINPDTLAGDLELMCHGLDATDGYDIRIMADGSVVFSTNQAAAQQQVTCAAGTVVINTWQLIGISRSGILGQIFKNGQELTYTTQDDLVDPLTSARKVLFGVYDDEVTDPWSEFMGRQRAWLDRQLTAAEHLFLFEMERNWHGV